MKYSVLIMGLFLFFTAMLRSLLSVKRYLEFTRCDEAFQLGLAGKFFMTPKEKYILRKLILKISKNPEDPLHHKAVELKKNEKTTAITGFLGFFLIIIGGFLSTIIP